MASHPQPRRWLGFAGAFPVGSVRGDLAWPVGGRSCSEPSDRWCHSSVIEETISSVVANQAATSSSGVPSFRVTAISGSAPASMAYTRAEPTTNCPIYRSPAPRNGHRTTHGSSVGGRRGSGALHPDEGPRLDSASDLGQREADEIPGVADRHAVFDDEVSRGAYLVLGSIGPARFAVHRVEDLHQVS